MLSGCAGNEIAVRDRANCRAEVTVMISSGYLDARQIPAIFSAFAHLCICGITELKKEKEEEEAACRTHMAIRRGRSHGNSDSARYN